MAAIEGKAVFVPHPRRIEDLHDGFGTARPSCHYIIEAAVELDWIDYENFITDMLADRWFLEINSRRCFSDAQRNIYHCLLVSAKDRPSGVLVLPRGDHVAEAALYRGRE